MKRFNLLLLTFSLSPLILIAIISLQNLNQPVKLKILIWNTPQLAIGHWIALGGSVGILFSSTFAINSSSLMYRQNNNSKLNLDNYNEIHKPTDIPDFSESKSSNESLVPPVRDLRDPAPTISVPWKVLNNSNDKYNYSSSNFIDEYSSEEIENIDLPDEPKRVSDNSDLVNDWDQQLEDDW